MEGFRSIRHLELDLTTDVTVLIGANGSGKSNLVSALELVSRVVDNTATDRLTRQAGVARQYFDGPSGSVDSILIDEARTPLIISGPAQDTHEWYPISHCTRRN